MLVTRTPYRVSFFGGSSDYPVWYRENGGAVLSTAIDKYCVIIVRYLPPFFEHKHRIVYRQIESVRSIDEINHPSVRECFRFMNVEQGIEVLHVGDVPARSGLGTSSSFTVGMLNALYTIKGESPSKMQLALDAIHVEQDLIKEACGSQDQVAAAFGGFNNISFSDSEIKVKPVKINSKIEESLMLVYAGLPRYANDVVQSYRFDKGVVSEMQGMVDIAVPLAEKGNVKEFARLLNQSWVLKKRLSDKISTPYIDTICTMAEKAGAIGYKICGGGGGGFVLLVVEPDAQPMVRETLKGFLFIPFSVDFEGSRIMFDGD